MSIPAICTEQCNIVCGFIASACTVILQSGVLKNANDIEQGSLESLKAQLNTYTRTHTYKKK